MANSNEVNPEARPNSTPRSSNLILKLLVLVALVVVAGGLFLFLRQLNIFPFSKTSSPGYASTPNVFFQTKNDPTGRTVFYTLSNKHIYYSGLGYYGFSPGEKFTPESSEEAKIIDETVLDTPLTRYIVAAFDKWEDIPNSDDKYLVFGSQVSYLTKDQKTHEIKKVRVLMDKKDQKRSTTLLEIEDLSTIIPKVTTPTGLATLYNLGSITGFTNTDLDILIKKDDVLAVEVFLDIPNLKDFTDEDGIKLTSKVVLRRFNPKEQLLIELGRNILE